MKRFLLIVALAALFFACLPFPGRAAEPSPAQRARAALNLAAASASRRQCPLVLFVGPGELAPRTKTVLEAPPPRRPASEENADLRTMSDFWRHRGGVVIAALPAPVAGHKDGTVLVCRTEPGGAVACVEVINGRRLSPEAAVAAVRDVLYPPPRRRGFHSLKPLFVLWRPKLED